ncbi:hypothetical protein DL96DRAFT_1713811 [Flagelloscypha sp. PMI_526]|nr:hypothetical protein DL96DRAFT_1713811 [Flagelloscypha sp. PMI_526]
MSAWARVFSIKRPSSHMKTINNLPLDVLRLLFEYAASSSLESAQTLSLVSKEVQFWTDPHLFHTVQRKSHDGDYRLCLLDQMCLPEASTRLVQARNYVRIAAWEDFAPHSNIKRALEKCPNIIQLCLWGNVFPFEPNDSGYHPFEITQSYPSLRRVATNIDDLENIPPSGFSCPFWMTITHLQVNYYSAVSSPETPFQVPLFAAMTSLTHLAFFPSNSGAQRELDYNVALSRIKNTFPPSLILCLLSLMAPQDVAHENWLVHIVKTSRNVDHRIVLWSWSPEDNADEVVVTNEDDAYQVWCGVQDGVQTFWEMGEAILEKRKERVAPV